MSLRSGLLNNEMVPINQNDLPSSDNEEN